mgnify:CR=1 FL=1
MNKSDQAYKTIGEVVKILDIKNKSGKKTPTLQCPGAFAFGRRKEIPL